MGANTHLRPGRPGVVARPECVGGGRELRGANDISTTQHGCDKDGSVGGVGMRQQRSLAAVVAAVLAAVAFTAVPAPAADTDAPVIVSPQHGAEVPTGFDGPVSVDFSAAVAGRYVILVGAEEGGLGDTELATVDVDSGTGTVARDLPAPLDKGGVYRVVVRSADATTPTEVVSRFTVLGGEDPEILGPGRSVALGFAGPLVFDFSQAPVGYYDLELRAADGGVTLWWSEMMNNHEDRTLLRYTIDPIMEPGKYVLTVTGTSNTRGYDARLVFQVRRR